MYLIVDVVMKKTNSKQAFRITTVNIWHQKKVCLHYERNYNFWSQKNILNSNTVTVMKLLSNKTDFNHLISVIVDSMISNENVTFNFAFPKYLLAVATANIILIK